MSAPPNPPDDPLPVEPEDRLRSAPPAGEPPVLQPAAPQPRQRPSPRRDQDYNEFRKTADDGGVSTIIPYKNGWALASYYCGVFSLIPLAGHLLGPLALLFGILGLVRVSKYPTARGTAHAVVGLILGLLTTVVWWGLTAVVVVGLSTLK
jgi:hypothetical protein